MQLKDSDKWPELYNGHSLHLRNELQINSVLFQACRLSSNGTTTAGVKCSRNYFTISDMVQYTTRPIELFLSYIHRRKWNVPVHVLKATKLHISRIIIL